MSTNATHPRRADYQAEWAYTSDLEVYCKHLRAENAEMQKVMVDAVNRLNNMANYGKLPAPLKREVQAIADALTQSVVRARAALKAKRAA